MRPAFVPHPGVILKAELKAREWSQIKLAKMINRSASIIRNIVNGYCGISKKTAGEFGEVFGTSPDFWIKLQSNYNAWKLGNRISECPKCKSKPKVYKSLMPKDRRLILKGYIISCDHIHVTSEIKHVAITKWNEKCKELK